MEILAFLADSNVVVEYGELLVEVDACPPSDDAMSGRPSSPLFTD